ncbi:hypothetical protein BGZ98_008461 [Dissophora globulifera]|nr:hypothetical protein BGZ98_008461 [Dissophora globulifera]
MTDNVSKYGLSARPADQEKDKPENANPKSVPISALKPPTTPLATRIDAYCKSKLPAATYRHSLRVYSYGCAIARECYPSFALTPGSALDESWFCTAMLHDIGTTPEHISGTRLSYEFWAGYHALDLLQDVKVSGGGEGVAEKDQAESIAEAIIRHQDVQPHGKLTLLTRLIHWGTLLDNIGAGAELVDRERLKEFVRSIQGKGGVGVSRQQWRKRRNLSPMRWLVELRDLRH